MEIKNRHEIVFLVLAVCILIAGILCLCLCHFNQTQWILFCVGIGLLSLCFLLSYFSKVETWKLKLAEQLSLSALVVLGYESLPCPVGWILLALAEVLFYGVFVEWTWYSPLPKVILRFDLDDDEEEEIVIER